MTRLAFWLGVGVRTLVLGVLLYLVVLLLFAATGRPTTFHYVGY